MGNRYLLAALEMLAQEGLDRQGELAPFENVVWASLDVDAEGFTSRVSSVRHLARRMTLYASQTDRALAISRHLHGGYPRAGDAAPPLPVVIHGLATVNTSGHAPFGLGHADFAGPAFDDLRALIWLGIEPGEGCILSSGRNAAGGRYWRLGRNGDVECATENFGVALTLFRWLGPEAAKARVDERIEAFQEGGDSKNVERWTRLRATMARIIP